jgi:hypothetical protein
VTSFEWVARASRLALGQRLCLGEHSLQAFEVTRDCVTLDANAFEALFSVSDERCRTSFSLALQRCCARLSVLEHRARGRIGGGSRGLSLVFRCARELIGFGANRSGALLRFGQLRRCLVEVALRLRNGILLAREVFALGLVAAGRELDLKVDACLFGVAGEASAVLVVVMLQLRRGAGGFIGQSAPLRFSVTLESRSLLSGRSLVCRSRVGDLSLEFCALQRNLLFRDPASVVDLIGERRTRARDLVLERRSCRSEFL